MTWLAETESFELEDFHFEEHGFMDFVGCDRREFVGFDGLRAKKRERRGYGEASMVEECGVLRDLSPQFCGQ
jgi:hypothetical protein